MAEEFMSSKVSKVMWPWLPFSCNKFALWPTDRKLRFYSRNIGNCSVLQLYSRNVFIGLVTGCRQNSSEVSVNIN